MEFSLTDLPAIAQRVLDQAKKNISRDHATLITFSGDLGSGKTALIQEIARALGVPENLQSPTFVIYKIYKIPKENGIPFKKLIHGDMYRLESENEIEKLGWNALLLDSNNLICIEWPENIKGVIPEWATRLFLRHKEETMRELTFYDKNGRIN